MPSGRQAYLADLKALCSESTPATTVPYITGVKAGDDDGSFVFTFSSPDVNVGHVEFAGMVTELSDYPQSHQCLIYATDDAPPTITDAIVNLSDLLTGRSLRDVLTRISSTICQALQPNQTSGSLEEDEPMLDEQSDEASDDGWSNYGLDPDGDSQMVDGWTYGNGPNTSQNTAIKALREDLKAVKAAGFRVGVLGDYNGGRDMYVSISIRIAKLGLSEEALGAWNMDRTKYIVVLIHFTQGYRPLHKLTQDHGFREKRGIEMCVGTHTFYKPTLKEAITAFSSVRRVETLVATAHGLEMESLAVEDTKTNLEPIFMSGPLHELLNRRFTELLKYRIDFGLTWDGAEAYYNEYQGREGNKTGVMEERYYESSGPTKDLADVITADCISQDPPVHSFPLIAMQYTLRHLVRCTEFCLVCHNRLSTDFEALKPYVCSNPLCLYQYMSLGFGPSIEHEIVSQPNVVDLLVSFCYASAHAGVLNNFPVGMSLMVPATNVHHAIYDRRANELIFAESDVQPVLRVGDWISMTVATAPQLEWHTRILEVDDFPKIVLAEPIEVYAIQSISPQFQTVSQPVSFGGKPSDLHGRSMSFLPESQDTVTITFHTYNTNFDNLPDEEKRIHIVRLLSTLPKISEMKVWLKRNTKLGEEASLKNWMNRISPAALGCLRWVIASNRSCIVALDDLEAEAEGRKPSINHQKVQGIQGDWLQFRFAMGAPDKEQRFITAVREVKKRLNSPYPSLFAFHGSPLANWHSIIREGLHFNKTSHGRAFGHGCYHSLELETSATYSNGRIHGAKTYTNGRWLNSELNIICALSLNEIVHAPGEYVSNHPHLVVAQLDWIQTRYLFVQRQPNVNTQPTGMLSQQPRSPTEKPTTATPQDPKYTPRASSRQLIIPAHSGVRPTSAPKLTPGLGPPKKKFKSKSSINEHLSHSGSSSSSGPVSPVDLDVDDVDDTISISSTSSDRDFFLADEPSIPTITETATVPETDFIPETLDFTRLPLLPPPSYKTRNSTLRLQADLKTLIETQDATPLASLGFYISPSNVTNLYQWVIELHSFPSHLPLVKDMKSKSPPLSSIVLELRFGPSYPMSPPFVRVLKPRFLEYMRGGGGNVTNGGALCMELLTNTGWSAVNTIESVLLQVRMMICDEERPARLMSGPGAGEYGEAEAKEAYLRACRAHGWEVPSDFNAIISARQQ
ncbi:hypothetical protein EX30DRAFT_339014 [Ascodesmis nigricans]|uniref:UBC core domain-containing protein n=1 Tax=Ascodesmis nigricans TaxID=341454 RepID=A0A4S2N109_9PEZI|nr:hypothetical protein EX30DRAFT_339014 [Ascodesmis nigricans]